MRAAGRSHRAAALVSALVLGSAVWGAAPAQANGCIAPAAGTAADPYLISTASNLNCLKGNPSYWTGGKYFRQTNDIDLTGFPWIHGIGDHATAFDGHYDGGGFAITNLSIMAPASNPEGENIGLFGQTDGSSITDTNVAGQISGKDKVGGLIGRAMNTTVTRSTADVAILGLNALQPYHGGLIGYANNVTVTDASTQVAIGISLGGGLTFVGGLIGAAISTEVARSRTAGTINGSSAVGGLIGLMIDGNVSESFATSTVTSNDQRGGLIGYRDESAVVRDVFARGSVTGPLAESGGLIGFDTATGGLGSQTRAYSTGRVSGSENVGGFIGLAGSAIPWTASFWDTQTSGQTSAESSGVVTGVTGLATSAMTDIATYRAAGWNIGGWAASGTTWGICAGVNDGYPYLQAFYASNPCDDGPTPPPWPQAYARGSGDTCLPGWNPSWAEWPNGNTGGFVCQRTLVYNRSTGQWDARRLVHARI